MSRRALVAVIAGGLGLLVSVALTAGIMAALTSDNIQETSGDTAETVDAIRATQKSTREIINYINDCTEPTGVCYQRGRAQEAAQAGALNAAVIAAAWCRGLPEVDSLNKLRRCVGSILEDAEAPMRGTP